MIGPKTGAGHHGPTIPSYSSVSSWAFGFIQPRAVRSITLAGILEKSEPHNELKETSSKQSLLLSCAFSLPAELGSGRT